jgi:type I restriction enzyme M protein
LVTRKLRELTDEDIAKIADTFSTFENGKCGNIKAFALIITIYK